ncbi:MAG: hypothetical protein KGJ79_16450 [Alphaproteobacteria bacterium]|nr:hypothetical protein [Alphaproteobacteria bacterium]MDE2495233.1 hypothetical protein [Alphaproteobacteria bacterium]MDE2499957.1 hypothetical protein [Alphaproteobacteria bacterium]
MAILDKVLEALKDIPASNYDKAPPLHRLAWRLGIMVPPPMLAGFVFNLLLLGTIFAVLWGLSMALVMPLFKPVTAAMPGLVVIVASLAAGAMFGFFMALYMRSKTAHYDLPSWQSIKDAD